MGDSRRFDLFAKVIKNNFPIQYYPRVADIGGGKGYLQTALRSLGYNVTTFDKRKGRRNRIGKFQYQYRYFDNKIKDEFDLLVGMHPDEATDIIIIEASKRSIPFIICPCCVKPSAVTYWGKHSYRHWVEHLERLSINNGFKISRTVLPMNGKNQVLIGRFY